MPLSLCIVHRPFLTENPHLDRFLLTELSEKIALSRVLLLASRGSFHALPAIRVDVCQGTESLSRVRTHLMDFTLSIFMTMNFYFIYLFIEGCGMRGEGVGEGWGGGGGA